MAPSLHVRPATPADGALLARLRLDGADGRGHVTLAAVDPRDGSLAGVARSTRDGVAFVVAEGWPERSVRAELALALLGRSRSRVPRLMSLMRGRLAVAAPAAA